MKEEIKYNKYVVDSKPQAGGFELPRERNKSAPVDLILNYLEHRKKVSNQKIDPRKKPMGSGWRASSLDRAKHKSDELHPPMSVSSSIDLHQPSFINSTDKGYKK